MKRAWGGLSTERIVMPSTWIAIVLSICTFGGGYAVVEFDGVLATVVKVLYACSILSLAAYLALHGTDESPDALDSNPGPGNPVRIMSPEASKA